MHQLNTLTGTGSWITKKCIYTLILGIILEIDQIRGTEDFV